jgi:hypothetical protein
MLVSFYLRGMHHLRFNFYQTILHSKVLWLFCGIVCGAFFAWYGLLYTKQAEALGSNDVPASLLLHFDGSDGATTFTDSCRLPATFAAEGNAQLDTAQSKFGGASALFDGTGDSILETPIPKDLIVRDQDFTIDFWVRFNANDVLDTVIECGTWTDSLILRFGDGSSANTINFYSNGGADSVAWTRSTATWYHVAVTRQGSNLRFFVDGTQTGATQTNSDNIDCGGSDNLRIGASLHAASQELNGWIDEFRFTKGRALWTSNFTAPTAASECYGDISGQTTFTSRVYIPQDVNVTGNLAKGSGSFVIDHPLDPVNKLLYHSFVESPEAKNIYDGIVTLDQNGTAVVTLPDYFEALNKDYRFLLTPIGQSAPELFIQSNGITNNSFTIVGGPPNVKVSWQVTGNRQDPFILANPIITEVLKGPDEIRDVGEFLFKGYAE